MRPGGLKGDPPTGALFVSGENTLNSGEISRDLVADVSVAALFDAKAGISRNQLAADMVSGLLGMLAGFENSGFAPWLDAWNQRHAYAGLPIRVIQGERSSDAVAGDVDESGNLWVTENGHSRRLSGGEISVRRRL